MSTSAPVPGADNDGAQAQGCATDAQCTMATPRCDVASGQCVQCLPSSGDCLDGTFCSSSFTCIASCTTAADCPMNDAGASLQCCAGLCADTASDLDNCGSCGNVCPASGSAFASCGHGACVAVEAGGPCASGALAFDGSDFVDIPGSAGLLGAALTVEAWIKTTEDVGGGVILGDADCSNDAGWSLAIGGSMSPLVGQYFQGGEDMLGTASINDGAWHQLAVTWDGTNASLYVDGVLQGSPQMVGAFFPSGTDIQIGAVATDGGTCNSFQGLVDEVSLWSVARTPAQIGQDHTQPVGGSQPGLEGYWTFDDSGCGLVARDQSGHGLDGLLGGSSSATTADPTWVADGPW